MNKHKGSSLDSFLEEEGVLKEVLVEAIMQLCVYHLLLEYVD